MAYTIPGVGQPWFMAISLGEIYMVDAYSLNENDFVSSGIGPARFIGQDSGADKDSKVG